MRRSRDLRLSNAGPAAVLVAVLAVPAALLLTFGARHLRDLYVTHMVAVGATMLVAGIAAVLLTRAGTRRGDVRAVAVGTAFAAMAALLLIHALATPEVFVDEDDTGLVAFPAAPTSGSASASGGSPSRWPPRCSARCGARGGGAAMRCRRPGCSRSASRWRSIFAAMPRPTR